MRDRILTAVEQRFNFPNHLKAEEVVDFIFQQLRPADEARKRAGAMAWTPRPGPGAASREQMDAAGRVFDAMIQVRQ